MTDIGTTTLIMLVAAFWGAVGGIIYWATPKRPKGLTEFLKRVSVGGVAGAVMNVFGGISAFDEAGAWDTEGVSKLIVAGFVGLSAIAAFLPNRLNENARREAVEKEKLSRELARTTIPPSATTAPSAKRDNQDAA
ncbi:MAG: hypothetical protein KAR39_04400 [Thermoplasmata archaeon]|nr:hypothetical protein [Thermoplasmata archaeon]